MAYTDIDKSDLYFNTVLYTGDGTSDRTITNTFGTDFLWLKERNGTDWHHLWDKVRGDGKRIHTNNTNAESDLGTYIALVSNGFKVDGGTYNNSSVPFVAWQWKANGTGVANTDGSISSTVSANTTSGFSIVSFTGTGVNATIGHGLGTTPGVVIVKRRTVSTGGWILWHNTFSGLQYMIMNETGTKGSTGVIWNSTVPTSSVFSIGTSPSLSASGSTFVAYCFAEKKGFSKFGSYTGNGSTDGTFVYTGFRPAWVMMKRTDTTNDWFIFDSKRNTFNETDLRISANSSSAESDQTGSNPIDILSNGFKCRGTAGATNLSGGTYIYMAFAENPFTTSTGIPTTAR
jgi:hypothetical protein